MSDGQLSVVEIVKQESNYLRGTLVESLADPLTGAIAENDTHLSKFHGIYQQDDRDVRAERQRQKLEPAFGFMIRARVVAGRFTSRQWLQLDELVRSKANAVMRLTTRQTFQLHGVLKKDLKFCVQAINALSVDTLAACGDVNRNVMCTPMRTDSSVYQQTWQTAVELSKHLTPRTRAYEEIWLNGVPRNEAEEEPLYGASYLPRKFKIGFAVPPRNDIDVFTQDLGFIAIQKDDRLLGFNVTLGGGMGMTHGDDMTYPRLGSVIGSCRPDQVVALAQAVVTIQRDYGNRSERKQARLKYTLDARGLEWFCKELERRAGFPLAEAEPFQFDSDGDLIGWHQRAGHSHENASQDLTLFVPGGRISNCDEHSLLDCLREIAKVHEGDILFTPNQNLILAGVASSERKRIDSLLSEHRVTLTQHTSACDQRAMACVALPTCGLAMAEAERYLPRFVEKFSQLLKKHNLEDEAPSIRITGCPNGCARPYVAEVALIGKAPGHYNLMLGGSSRGDRLNWLHRENLPEAEILKVLDAMLESFSSDRQALESFGDYLHRTQANPDAPILLNRAPLK